MRDNRCPNPLIACADIDPPMRFEISRREKTESEHGKVNESASELKNKSQSEEILLF
jgi:hypothetical protein